MFENLLSPVLAPLLKLPAIATISIISVAVSVIMVLIYKLMTDQHVMKSLKEELSKFRKDMKQYRDDPKKMMEIQKQSMSVNMEYMKRSMKPTIVTLLPILIIFGWLSSHMAYEPINPGEDFITTAIFKEGIDGQATLIAPDGIQLKSKATQEVENGTVAWTLTGDATGEHILEIKYDSEVQTKAVIISEEQEYAQPIKLIEESNIEEIQINNKKNKPLNLFGWRIGWLGTYIIISLVVSMSLRKLMGLA